MIGTSTGIGPEVNKVSISPDTREMTFRSLMTAEGRGQLKNSAGSVPRIDDMHDSSAS